MDISYTGQIWVHRDGKSQKMYLLIFTCMNVKAIHIELVADMSAQAFIQALIRFCNIYGMHTHKDAVIIHDPSMKPWMEI